MDILQSHHATKSQRLPLRPRGYGKVLFLPDMAGQNERDSRVASLNSAILYFKSVSWAIEQPGFPTQGLQFILSLLEYAAVAECVCAVCDGSVKGILEIDPRLPHLGYRATQLHPYPFFCCVMSSHKSNRRITVKRLKLIAGLTLIVLAFSAFTVSAQDDPLGIRGDDRFAWDSLAAFEGLDLGGEDVLFFGPWETEDLEYLNNVLAYFNSVVTNGSVTYVGSGSFEQEIVIQCEGGNPPHLAAFPQPGLAADMAADGCLTALDDEVRAFISEGYAGGDGWNAFATYPDAMGENQLFGIWYNVNLKSLVWYVPDNFDENGYEIPTSWDELIALRRPDLR